jgi:hypothetical protein
MNFDLEFNSIEVIDLKKETIKSRKDADKSWQKITVVLYTAGVKDQGFEYEKYIPVVFFGANARKAEHLNIGDIIDVKAEIGGRMWEKDDKKNYFLEINGWYCSRVQTADAGTKPSSSPKSNVIDDVESEELPF